MRIALFSITALTLFGGSLFLEKAVTWGRFVPWWFAGFGGLAIILALAFRSKIKARLGSASFGDALLNSLGLIVLVLGFLSSQWAPTIAFLVEVWLFTLLFRSREQKNGSATLTDRVGLK